MKEPKNNVIKCPWLDKRLENLFRTELVIAADSMNLTDYKSHPAFDWINKNHTKNLLFKALEKYAPLFPVIAYKGNVSVWLSPPPSGQNNQVTIIMGKDQFGKIRVIGANYLNWPTVTKVKIKSNFFEAYDSLQSRFEKEYLMMDTISYHMSYYNKQIAISVTNEAELMRTMPIALLILDGERSYVAFAPAIVYGNYPSDMSKEFIGEVL